jgi:hypothetical protein
LFRNPGESQGSQRAVVPVMMMMMMMMKGSGIRSYLRFVGNVTKYEDIDFTSKISRQAQSEAAPKTSR